MLWNFILPIYKDNYKQYNTFKRVKTMACTIEDSVLKLLGNHNVYNEKYILINKKPI